VRSQIKLIIGVIIGLSVAGIGSVAVLAAVPDDVGLIHGCYQTSGQDANGQMRIIDSASASCGTNETEITFNKKATGQFNLNLSGADLSFADLRYRNFAGADLHNATFNGANTTGDNFHAANLNGVTFASSNTSHADFSDATLDGATFDDQAILAYDNITGVDLRNIQPGGAMNINQSNLTNVNFRNFRFNNFTLASNTNTGADYTDADFVGSNLYADDLSDATMTGTTWSNTICPDLTNSNDHGATCIGHLVP